MSEPKTKPTRASVDRFIAAVPDPQRREESRRLVEMMQAATGDKPVLWGTAIVGFGRYHYRYDSGREGDWPITGFSPRKRELSLYIMSGFDRHADLLARLGRHRIGVSCLYLRRLDEIDMDVLDTLVRVSVDSMRERYPEG